MNRKRYIGVLFFLSFVVPLAFSAEPLPIISVLNFESSGISNSDVAILVDYITSLIASSNKFRVIDRMQREEILAEIEFSRSDCSDEKCQLEIGKLLSASQIIVGSLGRVSNRYLLTLKLIDVETGVAITIASEKYQSMDELIDKSEFLVWSLLSIEEPGAVDDKRTAENEPIPSYKATSSKHDVETATQAERTTRPARKGSSIELLAGYSMVKWYLEEELIADWEQEVKDEAPEYLVGSGLLVAIGYTYQFSSFFSIGGVGGALVPIDSIIWETEFGGNPRVYTTTKKVREMGVVRFILGNKVDGIAVGIGVGTLHGSGLVINGSLFVHNFFLDCIYYDILLAPAQHVGGWGVMAGYSIYFNIKKDNSM